MRKLLSSLLVALLWVTVTQAQERTVRGTVTASEDGSTLPGVSIKVKGSTVGTQSGANGQFTIQVPSERSILVFTYIGYAPQEVAVGSRDVINTSLNNDAEQLSEVVVVAYGTARKEEITGSIATMSSADIEKRTVTNISNALAGLAPGVSVSSGNGQPGTGSAVRLRGFGSLSASNAPLYVLDGAAFDGNVGDINPNDIESISLLKDATSTALYGSRGGNGVILITTKKGKAGKPKFNVNVNQGFSKRGTPEYDRVSALDYYPVMWQAMKNSLVYANNGALTESAAATKASNEIQAQLVYNPFNVPNNQIVGVDGKLNPNASLRYDDFNWFAPMERTGKRTDANMSLAGKANNSDYYVSLGYLDDAGYIIESDFRRFSGRININSQVKSWLKTGLNISGSMSDGNTAQDAATGSGNSFVNAFQFSRGIGPIYPVRAYDANGQLIINSITGAPWYDYGTYPGSVNRPIGASPGRHVIHETELNDIANRRNLIGARTYLDLTFLKDFTFTPSISIDLRNSTNTEYRNPLVGDGSGLKGSSFSSASNIRSYTFNQILKYNKTIKDQHNISALAGHENYDFTYRVNSATKTGLILQGNTQFDNFVTPLSSGGFKDRETLESYFSKLTYNFSQKYFLEGSLRRDGTSRFSKESRWGTFYSIGSSWAVSKEAFMSSITWVDDLRLKASYGEVGNNNILTSGNSNYYGYQAFYDLGFNNGSEPGLLLSSTATPDLRWESANTFNTGLSFSLFNKRLFAEVEYFKRGSDQLIFSVPQPLSDAITSINKNIGAMYNSGIELQLGGDIIRTSKFRWDVTTNFTTLKNKITKMPTETPVITSGTKRREVGKDFFAYWLRQFAGVDPSDGSSLYIPADGTAPASIRTVNGTPYVTNQSLAKFDYSGTAIPDFYGSVNSNFNYKSLGLNFLINYSVGGKFFDGNYLVLMSPRYGAAMHVDALNSWSTPGQITDIPRVDIGNSVNLNASSSRWLIDASYVSFRNVNLSYGLPKSLLNKINVPSARVFLVGENLGLISKRKGMNPTESFDGTNDNTYLPSRTFSFGMNFSL
jgi:TonB-linked SusC/RagA family outer membrane protein